MNYLAKTQIEPTDIGAEPGKHTAAYTAILNTEGGLIIGLANMEIYDLMDNQYWSSRMDKLEGWDAWCLDTNLPESGLQYLISFKNRPPLYLVASSPSKALRIKSLLKDINTLILNIAEANAIISQSHRNIDDGRTAARMLYTAGVNRAIVTQGANGAAWADKNGSGAINSPIKDRGPVRTSGAGDTLAAVAIAALEKGLSTPQALELGILASQHFMHTLDPDTPITWANLTAPTTIDYE
jgi:pseudouridine kinase